MADRFPQIKRLVSTEYIIFRVMGCNGFQGWILERVNLKNSIIIVRIMIGIPSQMTRTIFIRSVLRTVAPEHD